MLHDLKFHPQTLEVFLGFQTFSPVASLVLHKGDRDDFLIWIIMTPGVSQETLDIQTSGGGNLDIKLFIFCFMSGIQKVMLLGSKF